jgi:hypothetical protein
VARVLLTGMSGVGKSSALRGLAALGHRTVDADQDGWSRWLTDANGEPVCPDEPVYQGSSGSIATTRKSSAR